MIWTAALAISGCKGETKYRDSPQTVQALEACKGAQKDKEVYIAELKARIFDLEQKGGANAEVVVNITGDQLEISGKGPSAKAGGPAAPDTALFEAFVKQVQGARGSMQRCYQNALKKNTGLQARTITLNIDVRFNASGKVSRAVFKPRISDAFNTCMGAVAKRWELDGASGGITFRQPITLSPQ